MGAKSAKTALLKQINTALPAFLGSLWGRGYGSGHQEHSDSKFITTLLEIFKKCFLLGAPVDKHNLYYTVYF